MKRRSCVLLNSLFWGRDPDTEAKRVVDIVGEDFFIVGTRPYRDPITFWEW